MSEECEYKSTFDTSGYDAWKGTEANKQHRLSSILSILIGKLDIPTSHEPYIYIYIYIFERTLPIAAP